MTVKEITEFLDEKIEQNENEIVISFYEVRVKMNLSEGETNVFLMHCKTRLENFGYRVFFTGDKFVCDNIEKVVPDNDLMIAVRRE